MRRWASPDRGAEVDTQAACGYYPLLRGWVGIGPSWNHGAQEAGFCAG